MLMHSRQKDDIERIITEMPAEMPHWIFLFQTADKLIRTFAEQIFYTGFIHADPHPGNGGLRVCVCVCMCVNARVMV